MKTKDGEDFISEDEDDSEEDYGAEGGEDEIDEDNLEQIEA